MAGNRDYFSSRIKKSLLGPGSDIFTGPEEEEVISDYPLQRYYTGVLFPERTISSPEEEDGREEIGSSEDDFEDEFDSSGREDYIGDRKKGVANESDGESYAPSNQYFPTNCGMTFCVNEEIEKLKVNVSGATYKLAAHNEIRISYSENEKDFLFRFLPEEFKSKLSFDGEAIFFKDKPEGKTKKGRTKDYAVPQQLRKIEELGNRIELEKLERLLAPENRLWKRVPINIFIEIDLSVEFSRQTIYENNNAKLDCFVKVIKEPTTNYKYVKVLLYNASEEQPQKSFTNSNKKLNIKSFFQVQVSLFNNSILPYKPTFNQNKFDPEADLINYQYRKIKSFGIGHGCAVEWEEKSEGVELATSFFPEVEVPMVSNQLKDNPFFSDAIESDKHALESILNLKNLTIWSSLSQKEIISYLKVFVKFYDNWIEEQKELSQKEPEYARYSEELIKKQKVAKDRLLANIEFLAKKETFECFSYANTAMYIQLVTSTNNDFAKKHKELKEFSKGDIYDNLEYFKNYKIDFAYRPFQLAFLLLNIGSVIEQDSEDRNLVDLLWFPTGGGKTEAYLAVSAFTILWRRLNEPENYEGVSVIMRYTLRLLTAQQFERASRLICALEFLRKKTELFGKKEITIGMWVGAATTPNKFDEAKRVTEAIEEEINKKNKGKNANPEEKNDFQIEACPWCGCKTVSQDHITGQFLHAFDKEGKIRCLNDDCHFSDFNGKEVPVYVVDEYLYQNPPTLLFATVDKFAMLSHRAEGDRFFNSKSGDKGLPPDLIIQDELHLLNGPLGSIVGLFERLVEELCTKDGKKPKVIASTATTRNTDLQIKNLYNKKVAVFPPSGIHYNDSFFAFTLKESKRKYIGFMPTGKTGMDTQLEFLSHLLFARTELLSFLRKKYGEKQDEVWSDLDHYWTLVSYYNSLKDVGKTYNKVNSEVYDKLKLLHQRHFYKGYLFDFSYNGLITRTRELTSRVDSNKIKPILNELENSLTVTHRAGSKSFNVEHGIDLVLASNMISVGIDVGRLNLMLVNGQPRNVAEYIQASSRVARSNEGIVFNLLDSNRAREKSYFENYLNFHEAYYKFVEPLSLTPFTEITFDRMLNSILVCYVRHKKGLTAHQFDGDTSEVELLIKQSPLQEELKKYMVKKLEVLASDWLKKIKSAENIDKNLQYKGSENFLISKNDPWDLMFSMREIDKTGVIHIQ